MKLIIIDTGTANSRSIYNALTYVAQGDKNLAGINIQMADDPNAISQADALVLPGVGAFDAAVGALDSAKLVTEILNSVISRRTPILGICIGMQLLFTSSEEGKRQGLGIIDAPVQKLSFDPSTGIKVPHTGFAEVRFSSGGDLSKTLPSSGYLYFNHSFAVLDKGIAPFVDLCEHNQSFVASFQSGHIFGLQCHPEKSQLLGLRLIKNYLNFAMENLTQ